MKRLFASAITALAVFLLAWGVLFGLALHAIITEPAILEYSNVHEKCTDPDRIGRTDPGRTDPDGRDG